MTDGDEQRRAKQDVLSALNAQVRDAARSFAGADSDGDLWDFTCECGAPDCRVTVSLTLAQYEAQRTSGCSVLAAGHELD